MSDPTFPDWAKRLPWGVIELAVQDLGIDPHLVAAIIQVESGGNPFAVRAEPTFSYLSAPERWAKRLGLTKETEIVCQKMSWGLMQVMGGTARDLGYEDHLTEMIEPEVSIYWGVAYLSTRLKKYKSLKGAIAAYNAGSLLLNPDGTIRNQVYVDKVMKTLAQIR